MNFKYNSSGTLLAVYLLSMTSSSSTAFTTFSSHSSLSAGTIRRPTLFSTTSKNTDDAFSAFAESLDEDDLFNEDGDNSNDSDVYAQKTWQESLEELLDPTAPAAKRQILLTDLLSSNEDIRDDILAAVRERKVRDMCSASDTR